MTRHRMDLEPARAALVMINPAPYNAEAPRGRSRRRSPRPRALRTQQLRAADPRRHTAVGGAVGTPLALTLDDLRALPAVEHAVTLECAGNGRLDTGRLPTGEPWGGYAVSTARWKGARLQRRPGAGAAPRRRGRGPLRRGRPRHVPPQPGPAGDRRRRPDLRTVAAAGARGRPAAEILIAYEMNGEPLGPDHGAPFRLIVPHWYAVASVKWLKRIDVLTEPFIGEFQTGHYIYQWPDRPHEPVTPHARPGPHHRPGAGATIAAGALHDPRQGLVRGRPDHRGRASASPARANGSPADGRAADRPLPVAGLAFTWEATTSAGTPCGHEPPTPPATSSPTCRRGTGSATATTPSRSRTSTSSERQAPKSVT